MIEESIQHILFATSLIVAVVHFGVPLLYYGYLRAKWVGRSWNINIDKNYEPNVTIVIPTYNEAKYILRKLNNLYKQSYPLDKIHIVIVDSASNDGTPEYIRKWARKTPEAHLTLLYEPVRRGMVPALNYALEYIRLNDKDSDIVVFTDTDAFWETNALREITKFFADRSVGAVSTFMIPTTDSEKDTDIEATYRKFYNVVRLGESKIHSTPIHNGSLIAYRKEYLQKIGELPTYTGNNDSTPASLIAFMGYRAIQIDDTIVKEPVRNDQFIRKIRRAQHLILHFIHTKKYAKKIGLYIRSSFGNIWKMEWYLHLINPLLLPTSLVLVVLSAIMGNILALISIFIALLALLLKPYRMWMATQLYLILAMIRNLKTKDIIWKK